MKATVVLAVLVVMMHGHAGAGVKPSGVITVESHSFKPDQPIPSIYTCDGADISPHLSWHTVPAAAKSVVVFCDDPDAPTGPFVHWVIYDLPPRCDSLGTGLPKSYTLRGGGMQGTNDFKLIGYNGPCPPEGTHRYFFKVYALDLLLNLPAGKTKQEIALAIKGHVLAQGELFGTYTRKK